MRLWKLHQVDAGILEIKKRAAALDPGRAVQAELDTLAKQEQEVGGHYRSLHTENLDLELTNKGIEDKLKRIDKELYGGKVVNSREVDTLEKEIASLKRQRDKNDDRLLELMDLLPPAKTAAEKVEAKIAERKKALAEAKKAALATKAQLEAEFARLTKLRPEAAKNVSPPLLARYDSIRQKQGTGMAEVVKKRSCGGCGTMLPERTLVGAQEDKTVTCETCHRILYYTEGVV
jgi:hypothetical protein